MREKRSKRSGWDIPPPPPQFPLIIRILAGAARLAGIGVFAAGLLCNLPRPEVPSAVHVVVADMRRLPRFYLWLGVLAAGSSLAAYALLATLVFSMEILEFSIRIPWAAMVSSYTWLVVAGSGLCIINALGAVFGMHRYELMARRIVFVSMTSILFGVTYILLHLGRPERVLIQNLISPNFRSAISWMGALYNVYLVVVLAEFWLLIRKDLGKSADRTAGLPGRLLRLVSLRKLEKTRLGNYLEDPRLGRLIATLALVTGVAALTMLGSVFAHTEARSLWYGPYYPAYFLVSAVFTGYALLLALTTVSYRARREMMPPHIEALVFEMAQALMVVLLAGFGLTALRLGSALFDVDLQAPVMLLLNGPFSAAFWIFEVGCMTLLPLAILYRAVSRKHLGGVTIGSIFVLAGAFVMRYEFIVAGQVFPNIREGLPSYLPTFMECLLILGVFAAFLMTYTLGERFLPLSERSAGHVHA